MDILGAALQQMFKILEIKLEMAIGEMLKSGVISNRGLA